MAKTLGTILLAEDDKFLSRALQDKLTRRGYSVEVALTGEEAVKKAGTVKPDLMLLDIIMPLKDGFEVLTEIRGHAEAYGDFPIVMISNLSQETDKKKCLLLGATDYIVKSDVAISVIIERVDAILMARA